MEGSAILNKKNILLQFFLCLIFALSLSPCLWAEDFKKIVLLPFQVNSKDDPTPLQKNVYEELAGRLRLQKQISLIDKEILTTPLSGGETGDALAYAVAKEADAAFVITGSLTELGDVINADVRILDVKKGAFLPAILVQGKGREGRDKIFIQLAGEILNRLGAEQRIVRVEFKGNRRIDKSALLQVIKSAKGAVFSDANLALDIKAIYKLGYFSDVTARASDLPEGKVVTFSMREKGLVSSVKVTGNKSLGDSDISPLLSLKVKDLLNQEKIKADLGKIKGLYDSKGYYNAEVTEVIEPEGEKDVRVVYKIVENEKLYIVRINFVGNEAYTSKALRKLMATTEKGFFSFLTDSGLLKKEQLRQDAEKIAAFYLNHGFIYAQVGEPEITHDKKGTYIKIPITEGKQYQVGKVDIIGDEIKVPRATLLEKLQINKKQYYDRDAILKDMDSIQQACSDEGYAYADVLPLTVPQEKEQKVDVVYQIKKGASVYFNRINISGNTKTRDKVIRRLLAVVEGDLYSKTKLKDSYQAINRLRYFEDVDFQTEKGTDPAYTDVNIRVKEKPTGMFSIGAGYSAVDNAVFTAQVSQQNLFGRGQTLNLKANLGSRTTNYELSFVEPWLFDMPLWTKFDLWKMYREYDSYIMNSRGGGATFGYPLWEYFSGYIGYKLSNDEIYDALPTASSLIRRQMGEIVSSSLSFTLGRDTTDDNIFPTKGTKNSLSIQYTGGFLQGDASFIKYIFTSSWFYPLPWDTVFGLRGRLGYLQERQGKDAPVYERFILGGIGSLRGLRSVGPVDPATNDVIGGFTMLNFSAEYIFPLLKDAGMKGVLFFDTGNSWESGYYLKDMRRTAGAGIRWFSPIGPLRLEWGHVLDVRDGESASRWEFTIGMFM